MIVDTSALVAILLGEPGAEELLGAIAQDGGLLPSPARVEYIRVASGNRVGLGREATILLERFERLGLDTVAFTAEQARIASEANARYGKGAGSGGTLNLLDLMVYAVAKDRDMPILFTGRDFTNTDVGVHPSSRIDG